MKESDTGQDSKNRSGTKNPDRNLPDFFNRQMAFNPLHLNYLQQVRCCCWCKVKNSESKSQQRNSDKIPVGCCCCWCKVKNSESKSQPWVNLKQLHAGCCCWCKVKNSESKSQQAGVCLGILSVVVAGVKLKILKANHNDAVMQVKDVTLLLLV